MKEIISIDNINSSNACKKNGLLKGKVKITLLEGNNIVKEFNTENAIMDSVRYSNHLNYIEMGMGASFKHSSLSLFGLSEGLCLFKLSNDNYVVNPSKSRLLPWEYKTTGFCMKKEVYTGTSTTKGSYNQTESSIYVNENGDIVFHYVYDFPVHSGNGIINAIGFYPYNYPFFCGVSSATYNTRVNLGELRKVSRCSNVLDDLAYIYYVYPSNTGFALYKYNKFTQELTGKTILREDTAGYRYYRFNHTNKSLVGIIFNDKTTMNIKKYNLNEELIEDKTINLATSNGGTSNLVKAIMNDSEDILYIYDGSYLKVYDVKNDYKQIVELNILDDGEKLGSIDYKTIHVDNEYLAVTYYSSSSPKIIKKVYNLKDFSMVYKKSVEASSLDVFTTRPISYNNCATVYINDVCQGYAEGRTVSTLTKLPNPITKTDTQTMKVQYDIVYTPVNPLDFL